jgi:hypothetical protein
MEGWLVGLGAALGCMVAIWLALILARKLPPGLLRDLATFIPDCVTAVRRLHRDPRVPRRAKVAMLIAGLWVASPIDVRPLRAADPMTMSDRWSGGRRST